MKLTNRQLAMVLFDAMEKTKNEIEVSDAFVKLLAERNELHRISEIMFEFDKIWKEKFGITSLTIETAHPLSSETKKSLSKITKGAELKEIINEKLIGGAKIRIDDKIIDGSISSQLQQLKAQLSI